MLYFLIAIYCLLFAWVTWHRTNWAITWIVITLPSYLIRFKIGFIPFTLLEAQILLLFLIWFIHNFNYKKWPLIRVKFKNTKFYWLAFLWLVAATIATIYSPDLRSAAGIWKAYFVEPILFFLVTIFTLKKEDLKLIYWALGASALLVSIFAIYQKFTGFLVPYQYWYLGEGERVTSLFNSPNALGLYLGPIIVFYVAWIFEKIDTWSRSKISFFIKLLVIITGVLAIIFARSEGALLAVLLSSLIVLFWTNKWSRRVVVLVLLISIVLVLVSPTIPSKIQEKIYLQDWSGQVRKDMWQESWVMIKDNWLGGAGLAGYQKVFPDYHQKNYFEVFPYPHNFVLNFWSELGLFGLIVFLLIVIRYFWLNMACWLKSIFKSKVCLGLLGVMLVILIHGLVDNPYFKNDLSVMFWLWCALTVLVKS